MLKLFSTIVLATLLTVCPAGAAEPPAAAGSPAGPALVLADRGQPTAEIVVAPERPRMATLAALELQHFLHRVSGARLPIVTAPTAEARVRIHVGRSAETDRLGVKADDLRFGAYRIESGPDWLVLIGHDEDFDPTKLPLPLARNDVARAEALWDEATRGKTDAAWGFPFASKFKQLWSPRDFGQQMTARYGADFATLWKAKPGQPMGFWNQDAGGSFNAVCGLLHELGVRWYMPGSLGEVVPSVPTVSVGPFRRTVKPDFPMRDWNWYNFGGFDYDDIIWARRLGMNTCADVVGPLHGPHGMVPIHADAAMKEKHPDYYALINGKRDTTHRAGGTACFTSKGLEAEAVNYVRFLYDRYDLPSVDLWPGDGLMVCQCETCRGQSASDLVWGFVDRVAREVYRTHPDRRITCGAYTSYVEPPESIEHLSPNVCVWISNALRPLLMDPENWAEYEARIRRWQDKVAPGNILRLENNRYHIWGADEGAIAYPVLHPRAVARDLKFLKGISLGDTGEQSQANTQWRAPALEHVTLYVQSRFLWNADQDVDQVLDEYCQRFYGPAAGQMKEAITFAEQNLAYKDQSRSRGRGSPANVTLAVSLRFRELLDAARKSAGDTVHGSAWRR